MDNIRRQAQIALFALLIIIPCGIAGFMVIEQLSFLDAIWLTFITLTTIGYGDINAVTPAGRIFTIILILFGLSALASTLQATFALFFSPDMKDIRKRYHIQNTISKIHQHYIICGMGEMVDKTVSYLLQSEEMRRQQMDTRTLQTLDTLLSRIPGIPTKPKNESWIRQQCKRLLLGCSRLLKRQRSLLDLIVVVTEDEEYAATLRQAGLLVVEGDPASDENLQQAGIQRAQAMMVILENDTKTLVTVLTANTLNPTLLITASVLDEELGRKMVRVGATSIIMPFDVAAQFLNNATLRPAVNDFFNGVLFDFATDHSIMQLQINDGSPWAGQTLADLDLKERYQAGIIAIHQDDGRFHYMLSPDYVLEEDEVIIAIAPSSQKQAIKQACYGNKDIFEIIQQQHTTWQPITFPSEPPSTARTYSLIESETAVDQMSGHFIICGSDRVAKSALQTLDPIRPFVIISDNNQLTSDLLKRGFKVIHGNPTHEDILIKAGIKRARAIMITIADDADSILSIISCRTLNKQLLITAIARSDEMVDKLERAGADRVVSPFHIAARFIMLATTQPEIRYFTHYVMYNYRTGLETIELYMQDASPWIGKTIAELQLERDYGAGVIGIRQANSQRFVYAPEPDYVIQKDEVLIIITLMRTFDALRAAAHNQQVDVDPIVRSPVLQSDRWSRDYIKELLEQNAGS